MNQIRGTQSFAIFFSELNLILAQPQYPGCPYNDTTQSAYLFCLGLIGLVGILTLGTWILI